MFEVFAAVALWCAPFKDQVDMSQYLNGIPVTPVMLSGQQQCRDRILKCLSKKIDRRCFVNERVR